MNHEEFANSLGNIHHDEEDSKFHDEAKEQLLEH